MTGLSLKERFAALPRADRERIIAGLPADTVAEMARGEWWWTSRPDQVPPPGNWLIYLVLSGRGWGKALPIDTPIPTPSGWTTMGDLKVGEFVLSGDGRPTRVAWTSPVQLGRDCHRITFSDGASIVADGEHLWSARTRADRRAGRGYRTVSTREMLRRGLTVAKERNWQMPAAPAIELPDVDLPIDPYVLGFWLGDGNSADSGLTIGDQDCDEMVRIFASRGLAIRRRSEIMWAPEPTPSHFGMDGRFVPNGSLKSQLGDIGVIKNKHIPDRYLRAGTRQRLDLLSGLIDSDGYIEHETGRVEVSSTRERLATQIAELAMSLGHRARIYKGVAKLYGVETGPKYRVVWVARSGGGLLARKQVRGRAELGQPNRLKTRYVESIEAVASVPVRCIGVEAPSRLFLAGDRFLVTHNSRSGSEWLVQRTLDHPVDTSGAPTERLLIAETLADARNVCIGGPSGILRVLERRGIRYRYVRSPQPQVRFLDTGCIIHAAGADDADVGRGYNAADVWLDEFCIASGEPVETSSGRVPIELIRAGDRVMTRVGPRTVTAAWRSGRNVETLVIKAGGSSVTCTGSHPILTGRGWVRADAITANDTVAVWMNQSLARRHTSNGPESGGIDTEGTSTTGTGTGPCCTSRSGDGCTGRSRTDTTCITSTTTGRTTPPETCQFSRTRITAGITLQRELTTPGSNSSDPRLSARGCSTTGAPGSHAKSPATCVEGHSSAPGCGPSVARTNAGGSTAGDWRLETVESVTTGPRSDVYDLTVEGAHEFVAGGIIVHNCKWPLPREAWIEGIMPALRADIPGDHPRAYVTTTPKPIQILREWTGRDDGSIIVVRGSTFDNRSNLSSLIIEALRQQYDGTSIGAQELHGVLLEDAIGRTFSQADISTARIRRMEDCPALTYIVVGVDPGLTGEDDETGIVVVGADKGGDWYVLADKTILGVGREAALHAWRTMVEFGAKRLVVETNLGKKWMIESFTSAYEELAEEGLFPAGSNPPIDTVDAKAGKKTRAEPVGMRCEQHRLHMVGVHQKLEQQMVEFDPDSKKDSPDRVDALVHACRYHLKREKRKVTIATPVSVAEKREQDVGGLALADRFSDFAAGW